MAASVLLGGIRGARGLALTAAEFESLLAVLRASGDRASAGERYEALRRRLLIVFASRQCGGADAGVLADQTLDRVARRIHEGVALETSIESYVLGVARNVARELWKAPKEVELRAAAIASASAAEPGDEAAFACLDRCLDELQPRPRSWVMRFYVGTGGAKIAARKQLAAELGLDLNALRVRLFRIREKLEACLRNCLAGGNESAKGATH